MPKTGAKYHLKLKATQEQRRSRVAELYVQGHAQWRIVHILQSEGFEIQSTSTVSSDLKAVREQWRERYTDAYDGKLAEELAKLDRMEQVLWEAWFRSCEDAEGHTTKIEKALKVKRKDSHSTTADPPPKKARGKRILQSEDGEEELVPVKEIVERWVKGRLGNPAYIHEARECARLRFELMGWLKKDAGTTNVVNVLPADFWEQLRQPAEDALAVRVREISGAVEDKPGKK